MKLKLKIILIGLVVLVVLGGILFLPRLPVQAAANDILVYYTDLSTCTTLKAYPPEIFIADLNTLGYNVIIKYRSGADELGTIAAATINLLDYGQVWIIDTCSGTAFTASEITAVETFRNNGGGLLLSVDNAGCQERVNPITAIFNNSTNIFFGSQQTGSWCASSTFTWVGYLTVHPLYSGLTQLSSSNSDGQLNIQNPSIEVTAKNGANYYGAVLDEAGKGRIVFDTSVIRFMEAAWGDCSDAQESQYQQNIAQWLGRALPPATSCTWYNDGCGRGACLSTEMRQICSGPPGCSGGCTPGATQCITHLACTVSPVCGKCVTTFSDDSASKMVTLPPGGGSQEFGKISLPMGSYVCSAKLTLDKTVGPGITIGTPFIWVPLSGTHKLVQIRTSDGKIIHTFSNGSDSCLDDKVVGCSGDAFCNPSRITVFPGGDVWVANRNGGSVTRLGLKAGCTGDDCYECKGTYSDIGGGPRGVTFDTNGDIWVGDYDTNKKCKYRKKPPADCDVTESVTPDNEFCVICKNSGYNVYGMIGDSSGNVWTTHYSSGNIYKCSGDINCTYVTTIGGVYGIGMDNEGDIWFAGYSGGKVYEIDHSTLDRTTCGNVGGIYGPRGVAVDGNNNVWVANSGDNWVYVIDQDCNSIASTSTGYSSVIGVAIDAQNNGWIVSEGSGRVLKYKLEGGSLKKLLDINVGDHPYNYSDMTGFRTVALSLTIGGFSAPISHFPQEVSVSTSSLTDMLINCDCQNCTTTEENICGNSLCEIPISLSSIFAGGNFSLTDLEICYTPGPSRITGGLVPCGRRCDDSNTSLREDAPCTICHFFVLGKRTIDFLFKFLILPLTLLMIIVAGVKFIGSGGSPEKINEAKTILLAAIIGFLIAFSAWLIINSALSIIVQGKPPLLSEVAKILGQSWDKIDCPVP